MPSFDDPNDEKARSLLATCFPDRDILQIDALDIVEGGGGIHCITNRNRHENVTLAATQYACSWDAPKNVAKAKELVRARQQEGRMRS